MSLPTELQTDRLLLRRWRPEDRPLLAEMSADPRVMEFFPNPLTLEESDAMADRIEAHFEKHGFGFWAVEIPSVASFAGLIGLGHPRFEAHFTPCVEIGWRLAANHWNQGYATEAAHAALKFGFDCLQLREIVSMTSVENLRSRKVMEKIGMTHSPHDDFDNPMLPNGHPLQRHVLYRISNTKSFDRGK